MSSSINLKAIHIFSDLDDPDLIDINQYISWREFPKSKTILNFHELSTDVYFIMSGSVRATTYSASGREVSYQDLLDGDMFGELSALDNEGRITGIITLDKSLIGIMSADVFINLINNFPSINHKVMLRLTGLIRFLCGRIYEYSALDVKNRVRAEILRHARQFQNGANSALIENMPTHEEIASKIATHREAVTREFSYLAKEGLIEKRSRKIFIPDINKFASTILEEI